jgi:hypothetical protein
VKWANELKRSFSKEEIKMAKRCMKKCSTFLALKETEIKTTLRFNLCPGRIKNTKNKCW